MLPIQYTTKFDDHNSSTTDTSLLQGLTLLQEQLPAVITFHVPEDYYGCMSCVSGRSIQCTFCHFFQGRQIKISCSISLFFSQTDYNINNGVLQTAHSIFQQWTARVRSDELHSEINLVLSKNLDPFMPVLCGHDQRVFDDRS